MDTVGDAICLAREIERLRIALNRANERVEDLEIVLDQLVSERLVSKCDCGRYYYDECHYCSEQESLEQVKRRVG